MRPASLAADSAYGSAENLASLVKEKDIAPHIPVFDKSNRTDGTFSRADFAFDAERDRYTCPAGKELRPIPTQLRRSKKRRHGRGERLYRASELDCDTCRFKAQCCPNAVAGKFHGICTKTPATWPVRTPQLRNTWRPVAGGEVEMLFAHLKRILRLRACA